MGQKKRTLSPDDQKAVDVILDHAAMGRSPITRVASAVGHNRIKAATQILSLLDNLPAIEPAKNLIAKTMSRIDEVTGTPLEHQSKASTSTGSHLH